MSAKGVYTAQIVTSPPSLEITFFEKSAYSFDGSRLCVSASF